MFNWLDTQRATMTVVVFIGTFLVALTIGRLLKQRAGVRLGLLFRLFCLTLAFYAAIAVYGIHADWRNHVGAAVILLVLFIYQTATTWPGLLIVISGVPIYFLWKILGKKSPPA